MTRSAQELDDAIGRIRYSYQLLAFAAGWINRHRHLPREQIPQGWNIYIEAFLIHSRKLCEFLDPEARILDTDVQLSDFLPGEPRYRVQIDAEIRDQISKRIAHFSHVPVPDDKEVMEWPIPKMMEAITESLQRFADDFRVQDQRRWRRLDEALRGFEPIFRKGIIGPTT